jgi:hypothetical protein
MNPVLIAVVEKHISQKLIQPKIDESRINGRLEIDQTAIQDEVGICSAYVTTPVKGWVQCRRV